MHLSVGCRFEWRSEGESPAIVMVDPHPHAGAPIVGETWTTEPPISAATGADLYDNRLRRLVLPAGRSQYVYDAVCEIDDEPEAQPGPDDRQRPIDELPDEALHFLLSSRYCQSDALQADAWTLFGSTPPGAERVQAVCDWINAEIAYGVYTVPTTTVLEVYEQRGGMCRDFAHLGVTFCRALNVPARYAFGYMPDIGIPGPYPPMDFHAWFEVYLGDRWWTFDARFNTPRIGRVVIGRGRDAADVAMATTFGATTLEKMTVWSDAVSDPHASGRDTEHAPTIEGGEVHGR
jgi:transglutaminase-like putative cysteine protease